MAKHKSPPRRPAKKIEKPKARFTAKQGQYLAYLYLYRKSPPQYADEEE
jgi:hypothetical protein